MVQSGELASQSQLQPRPTCENYDLKEDLILNLHGQYLHKSKTLRSKAVSKVNGGKLSSKPSCFKMYPALDQAVKCPQLRQGANLNFEVGHFS